MPFTSLPTTPAPHAPASFGSAPHYHFSRDGKIGIIHFTNYYTLILNTKSSTHAQWGYGFAYLLHLLTYTQLLHLSYAIRIGVVSS